MIIPKKLSKFKNKNVLLFVSSKQNMIIYEVKKNNIKELLDFNVVSLPYSDNEGHFRSRSDGHTMKSGSVREIDNIEIIKKFIKELKKQIKSLKITNYESIFLFCPSYIKNYIAEALPVKFTKKLDLIIEGNFYSKKPLSILNKLVSETKREKRLPVSKEARYLIKKSIKARKVIKGKSK